MILLLKARHHLDAMNAPSQAQIAAGNYRKPKLKFQGLEISIENPRGSMRGGTDPDGKEWSTGMVHHYGYIRRTLGVDGDHFDCFVGPQADATHAYVITTRKPPEFTEPDEQKAMLGFPTEKAARDAFHLHYDDPRFLGELVEMPMAEFKAKVMSTRQDPRLIKALVLFLKAEGGKASKESVDYSKGMKSAHCGICGHFRPPHGCTEVAGPIDPYMWCERFKKAKG